MLTLSLLRHAKSSWDDERLADFDRPLAERGRKAAPRMGRHMRRLGLSPDRVLCSPALRTRQTAALVLGELSPRRFEVDYDADLYEADAPALMARLANVPNDVGHLLMIGHNPGLQELVLLFAETTRGPDYTAIAEKLPTGALVVLELVVDGWPAIRAGCGRIVQLATPRKLEAD